MALRRQKQGNYCTNWSGLDGLANDFERWNEGEVMPAVKPMLAQLRTLCPAGSSGMKEDENYGCGEVELGALGGEDEA